MKPIPLFFLFSLSVSTLFAQKVPGVGGNVAFGGGPIQVGPDLVLGGPKGGFDPVIPPVIPPVVAPNFQTDANGNGLSDVWESFYCARGAADTDSDGASNLDEAYELTDPNDANSVFDPVFSTLSGQSVVTWKTQDGLRYSLKPNTLTLSGSILNGTGEEVSAVINYSAGKISRYLGALKRDVSYAGQSVGDHTARIEVDPAASQGHTGLVTGFLRVPESGTYEVGQFGAATFSLVLPPSPFEDGAAGDPNVTLSLPGQLSPINIGSGGFNFSDVRGGLTPVLENIIWTHETVAGAVKVTKPVYLTANTWYSFDWSYDSTASVPEVDIIHQASGQVLAGHNFSCIPAYLSGAFSPAWSSVTVQTQLPDTDNDSLLDWEELQLGLDPYLSQTVTGIEDADSISSIYEAQHFYGPFMPYQSAETEAYGYVSLKLAWDYQSALVNAYFYNLTSPQDNAATMVAIGTPDSGLPPESEMGSLGYGLIEDYVWEFPASGCPFSAGIQLGMVGLKIGTVNYLNGEIIAMLSSVQGSPTFTPPSAISYACAECSTFPSVSNAVRFLNQATFGATSNSTAELVSHSGGIEGWIADQMNPSITPPAQHYTFTHAMDSTWFDLANETYGTAPSANEPPQFRSLDASFWTHSVFGKDQLRQRMAFALSQIFVVSLENGIVRARNHGMAAYQDVLSEHAFGNFRDLLKEVAIHPIMGTYLSMLRNSKGNGTTQPDENFAREIMQLFTIGLVELHPDGTLKLDADYEPQPTYDINDIKELARVFTGWSYSRNSDGYINYNFNYGGGPKYFEGAWIEPMAMFPDSHDTEAKSVLSPSPNFPANQSGEEDMDQAIDLLFNHPNTAPFIATRLIQRFVTSNPSAGYVYRVASAFENNGAGERGDLAAVLRAILLDPEARDPQIAARTDFGKLREPLIQAVHLYRMIPPYDPNEPISYLNLGVQNAGLPQLAYPVANLESHAEILAMGNLRYRVLLGQSPFSPPSVFNWFTPDYAPAGRIALAQKVAPEFQIHTQNQMIWIFNHKRSVAGEALQPCIELPTVSGDTSFIMRVGPFQDLIDQQGDEALIDHLDTYLLNGRLNQATKVELLNRLTPESYSPNRRKAYMHAIMGCPSFAIQK